MAPLGLFVEHAHLDSWYYVVANTVTGTRTRTRAPWLNIIEIWNGIITRHVAIQPP